jgi:phosphoenolpyruvate synthase/pyruvate phosphate dikinase
LIRRRVFRFEEEKTDEQGHEILVVYCARRDTSYNVWAIMPDAARAAQIQEELAALLE